MIAVPPALKALGAAADRMAMEAYLSKACWRAGAKLVAGLAVLGAVVGIRIVTATPAGVEGEIAELERFEAEQASTAETESLPDDISALSASASRDIGSDAANAGGAAPDVNDLDRLVRCILGDSQQFMRAGDCATRGGELDELPPPESEEGASPPES